MGKQTQRTRARRMPATGFAAEGTAVRTKPTDTRYRTAGAAVRPETYRRYVQAMQRSEADFRGNFGLARRTEDRVPTLAAGPAGLERAGYGGLGADFGSGRQQSGWPSAAQAPYAALSPARAAPEQPAVDERTAETLKSLSEQAGSLYREYESFQQNELTKLNAESWQEKDAAGAQAETAKQKSQELAQRTQTLRAAVRDVLGRGGIPEATAAAVRQMDDGLEELLDFLGQIPGGAQEYADFWNQFTDEAEYHDYQQYVGLLEAGPEKIRQAIHANQTSRGEMAQRQNEIKLEENPKNTTAGEYYQKYLDAQTPEEQDQYYQLYLIEAQKLRGEISENTDEFGQLTTASMRKELQNERLLKLMLEKMSDDELRAEAGGEYGDQAAAELERRERQRKLDGYEKYRENDDFEATSKYRDDTRFTLNLFEINAKDTYYRINNPPKEGEADGYFDYIRYMTDDEKSMANYLYWTSHFSYFNEYLTTLRPTLNARMMDEKLKEAREEAQGPWYNKVWGSIKSIKKNLDKIPTSISDSVKGLLGVPIDINDVNHINGRWANEFTGAVARDLEEKYGEGWSFAYTTGMGALNSAVNIGIATLATGGLGLPAAAASTVTSVLMGSQVAFDSIVDGKLQGWSDRKAVTVGIIRGTIEGITEKYSLDRILGDPRTVIGSYVKAFVTEGSEEVASNWLNNIVDLCVNDKNSIQNRVKAYVAQGHTADEALTLAISDAAQNDFKSFMAGGIAGIAMKGTNHLLTRAMTYTPAGRQINEQGQRQAVLDWAKGSTDYNARLAEKLEKSGRAENARLGELAVNMREEIAAQFDRVVEAYETQEPGGRAQTAADAMTRLREVRDAIAERGNAAELELADRAFEQAAAAVQGGAQAQTFGRYKQAVEERDQQIHRQFGKPGPDELPPIMAELDGEPVEVGARFQDGADGMQVLLADRRYVPLSELKFEDATVQAVYDAAGQYDARGAQTFLRQYTTSVPLKEYSRSFDRFYRSGLEGLSLESAMESFDGFAELIGEPRAVAAYNSGKAQRQAMMEAARSGQASADLSQKNRMLASNQEQQGEQVTDGVRDVPVGEDLQPDGKRGKIEGSGEGGSGAKIGDFTNLEGSTVDDILDRIPDEATFRELHPVSGGATEGFEFKWVQDGQTYRVRVHSADPGAPAGSNAASGWVVRIQRGRQYFDPTINDFRPAKYTNPSGDFFDESIMNNTHIPIKNPHES